MPYRLSWPEVTSSTRARVREAATGWKDGKAALPRSESEARAPRRACGRRSTTQLPQEYGAIALYRALGHTRWPRKPDMLRLPIRATPQSDVVFQPRRGKVAHAHLHQPFVERHRSGRGARQRLA